VLLVCVLFLLKAYIFHLRNVGHGIGHFVFSDISRFELGVLDIVFPTDLLLASLSQPWVVLQVVDRNAHACILLKHPFKQVHQVRVVLQVFQHAVAAVVVRIFVADIAVQLEFVFGSKGKLSECELV
jgi:hypothetical protein